MSPQGVYSTSDVCAIGDQISSTGEGRHITLYADNLEHGTDLSYVTKGRPVWWGEHAVGMPFRTQASGENLLEAVDTEGIWCVDVLADNDGGGSAVIPGQQLYINTTTGVVSKISDGATQICLGYALGNISSGNTERIAVKVHFDPSLDNAKRTYYTVTSGAYTYGKHHTSIFTGGESTGLEYFDQQLTGTQTGMLYGLGTWMELAVGFTAINTPLACLEVGLYDAGANLTAGRVIGIQMQIQVVSQPFSFYLFRVNGTNGYPIDAMFVVGNPDSLGWVTGADTATYNGSIPFYESGGITGWIKLYDGSS